MNRLSVKLTQELFGGQDSAQQRGELNDIAVSVINDLRAYFSDIIKDRHPPPPGEDLSTVLANANIDGKPMPVRYQWR